MRGRKPIPTALKLLHGNPGRRPLNRAEPVAPPHDGTPPAYLTGAAADEWRRLVPELHRLGILSTLDGDALALYCETWARWRQAEAEILKGGMVLRGRHGPIPSPYVAIASRLAGQLRAPLVEFGMTPSARARVKATPAPTSADPFAAFDLLEPGTG